MCAAEDIYIHYAGEIADIGVHVIVPVRSGGTVSPLERDALHTLQVLGEQGVCLRLDPVGDVRIGWTTVGWVVFESTIRRRIVRGRDDNAVGLSARASLVVLQDGVGKTGVGVYPS